MARRTPALILLLLLAANAGAAPTMVKPGEETAYQARDVAASEALERAPDVTVLDVRTPEEYAAGHIEGAVNVNVDDPAFARRVADLDRSGRYLVHCSANVPNGRSARAMTTMTELGFEELENLVGGFAAWSSAGGEIVTEGATSP